MTILFAEGQPMNKRYSKGGLRTIIRVELMLGLTLLGLLPLIWIVR